jgi:hypothetical protein
MVGMMVNVTFLNFSSLILNLIYKIICNISKLEMYAIEIAAFEVNQCVANGPSHRSIAQSAYIA